MTKEPIITVVGSINMDLVVSVSRNPIKGETILGESLQTIPGGKGANQAVAAARLGANVQMIGRVGQEEFGQSLIENLNNENVLVDCVDTVPEVASGVAIITLAENDNSIVVVPGANSHVSPEYVRRFTERIKASDIVLMQLEVPIETVMETASICHTYQVPFLLNPAPAQKLDDQLLHQASFITPNEIEREHILSGEEGRVLSEWSNKLIVTKGSQGVIYHDGSNTQTVPAFQVDPIDTTGAGDTFNAAFAYSYAKYKDLKTACMFANAASALSVQKFGAQTGMPTHVEVKDFLAINNISII